MNFLPSFISQYMAQGFLYSIIASIIVVALLGLWRISNPGSRSHFYLLVLVLSVSLPAILLVLEPGRSSFHFRHTIALFDSGPWLELHLWKWLTLGHVAAAMFVFTTVLFLVQEGLPWLVQAVRGTKVRPVKRGAFPLLDSALEEAGKLMGRRATPVSVVPGESPFIFTRGTLRPMFIVSDTLLRTATSGELTAMLCHEMAHLERRDHQRVWPLAILRAMACYNPMAWMVSRLAWHENEKACDDMAVRRSGDPSSLAAALLRVFPAVEAHTNEAEATSRTPRWPSLYAMEARATRAQVSERIGRLLHPMDNTRASLQRARLAVTAGVLVALLFFVV